MKNLIFTFLLLFSLPAFSQVPDSIFAEVHDNYVVIHDQGAQRNCGAGYQMFVGEDGNTITWLQADTGQAAYCICHFDMHVKAGPLEAGDYNAMIYYTEIVSDDTIYCGQTAFTIESKNKSDSLQVVAQLQTDCYNYVGFPERIAEVDIACHPNPANSFINFEINSTRASQLVVIDLLGKKVKTFNCNAESQKIRWDLRDESGNRIPEGTYFYTLQSGESRVSGKLLLK